MKRAAILLVAILVVCVGFAAFYLLRNLDSLVKDAIERYGSRATGTPVEVGAVRIGLREGRGTVRDLVVGNPEGFDGPHAMAWEEVTIDLDPGSVAAQPFVLDEVVIAAPEVILEVDAQGRANLRVLQQNLQRGAAAEEPKAESGAEPRLRIRSFTFERGVVEVRTASVGGKDARTELPSLQLSDLGGSAGATPTELSRSLLRAYTEQVLRTVARRELGSRVGDALRERVGEGEGAAAEKLLNRVLER